MWTKLRNDVADSKRARGKKRFVILKEQIDTQLDEEQKRLKRAVDNRKTAPFNFK